MFVYLSAANVVEQLEHSHGRPAVRDHGLLEAAVARPIATVGGEDAYPTLHEKVAALMHSLAKNHAFVDGNKRAALLAGKAMLELNGWTFPTSVDSDLYYLVLGIADGTEDEVHKIAETLEHLSEPIDRPLLE